MAEALASSEAIEKISKVEEAANKKIKEAQAELDRKIAEFKKRMQYWKNIMNFRSLSDGICCTLGLVQALYFTFRSISVLCFTLGSIPCSRCTETRF